MWPGNKALGGACDGLNFAAPLNEATRAAIHAAF